MLILALMHLNKKTELATVERILGSGAFANFSRSVLFTSSEEDSNKKRLVHEKYNLSQKANDLLFTPKAVSERTQRISISWEVAEENANMDSLLEKRHAESYASPSSAAGWLIAYLTGCKDSRAHKRDIMEAGKKAKLSKGALEVAQHRSGVISERNGDYHNPTWRLPDASQ